MTLDNQNLFSGMIEGGFLKRTKIDELNSK